jgi:LEA14-like dessication related protein
MRARKKMHFQMVLLAAVCLSACATVSEGLIDSPNVSLRKVQIVGLGFKSQTVLLSFDIANPNPFPLPIRNVGFDVRLDGQRFASGATQSNFTVPANGKSSFAISVDLDLLQTAPQLLSVFRGGRGRDVGYELSGRFALDIPFAPEVAYHRTGSIRLKGNGF